MTQQRDRLPAPHRRRTRRHRPGAVCRDAPRRTSGPTSCGSIDHPPTALPRSAPAGLTVPAPASLSTSRPTRRGGAPAGGRRRRVHRGPAPRRDRAPRLGPEVSLPRNPRLVYGRMTGWARRPLARRAGHDITYAAIPGALHVSGSAGPADAACQPRGRLRWWVFRRHGESWLRLHARERLARARSSTPPWSTARVS